ncbi:c-type cytochrome [Aestuariibacter salexigens]|uniref:c-type cytochrome n=1 Tax=Aestuariibacter salexigens TaxID=226010 RepID=UPI0004186490|nr:cytochrome c [Aestuariibacter salexigens]
MRKLASVAACAAVLVSGMAIAQPAANQKQADTAVQFRQALLQLVRSNVGAIGAMNKGQIPFDTAQMEKNGLRLEQLSLMMADYFTLDTREFDTDTEALDKIWEKGADFQSKIDALTSAGQGLQSAAKSGDESQYKAAIGDVFKSCKGCHDIYKAD